VDGVAVNELHKLAARIDCHSMDAEKVAFLVQQLAMDRRQEQAPREYRCYTQAEAQRALLEHVARQGRQRDHRRRLGLAQFKS